MRIANPIARLGEDAATIYLQKHGYTIIERNFRRGYGEIDIIATHKNTLIFVEVKTRTSAAYGSPYDAITSWKLRSLIKTAQFYKLLHPNLPDAMRIDAVSVKLSTDGNVAIEHRENISG